MNVKKNPWVSLAALALLLCLLAVLGNGCESVDAAYSEHKPGRFVNNYSQSGWDIDYQIITDTETGIQYLLISEEIGYGKGCGLTVLQPGATETEE